MRESVENVLEWARGGPTTRVFSPEEIETLATRATTLEETVRVRPRGHFEIADATQVWPALHHVETDWLGRNQSSTATFELWNDRGDVSCVFTSADSSVSLHEQVRAQYRDAEVIAESAVCPLEAGFATAVVSLPLRREELIPIRRYDVEGFEADPYGPLIAELVGADSVDIACVQVVAQPAKDSWVRGGWFGSDVETVAETLRSGELRDSLSGVYEVDASKADRKTANLVQAQHGMRAFHVDVRVVVQARSKALAVRHASSLARVFKRYFTSQIGQGFGQELLRGNELETTVEAVTQRDLTTHGYGLLTVPELAGVAHVPSMDTLTPPIDGQSVTPYDVVPDRAPSFEGDE